MMHKLTLTALCVAATAASAFAVPAKRGLLPVTQPDGSVMMVQKIGDERCNYTLSAEGYLLTADSRGMYTYARLDADGQAVLSDTPCKYAPEELRAQAAETSRAFASQRYGLFPSATFPVLGEQKAIVILVEYQDVSFTLDDPYTYFNEMLNKEGFSRYGGTGSCRDYFIEASGGRFVPEFDVYGPITLANRRSYYGGGYQDASGKPEKMALEACQQLDAEVDFSQYDRDGDGLIDNVFVFYAGQGEASYGPTESVWPHASQVTGNNTFDGVKLRSYGCTNEWEQSRPDGIGTFCHEFSHIMGLPDLYDTAEMSTYTPGEWSVLDYGPYNNDGCTPPTYSAFERNALGWIDLKNLATEEGEVTIPDLRTSNEAYVVVNPANDKEFYLFECRKQAGTDTYIPGSGMLVWHVDYNVTSWNYNTCNNTETHQRVDLVEADGVPAKTRRSDSDCFPGKLNVRKCLPRWWSGGSIGTDLYSITYSSAGDGSVTFSLDEPEAKSYYEVADVLTEWSSAAAINDVDVQGYIVGYVKSGTFTSKNVIFNADNVTIASNIVLADTPDETNYKACIPVQLVTNTDPRNDLNLMDNPGVLGRKVKLHGNIATYCSVAGVKSVTSYEFIDGNGENGIGEIETIDFSAPVEYFNLQGQKVSAEALTPGIYVVRQGTTVAKVKL